jgi:alanine dehydrogenase
LGLVQPALIVCEEYNLIQENPMNIGVPRERRTFEFRVGMTPTGIQMLTSAGHTCYVEHDAGIGAGFSDHAYEQAGARIVYSGHEAFGRADLLLKVARPTYEELEWVRPRTIVAGLLHLASTRQDKVRILRDKEITAISYEMIRTAGGDVPVRRPLSQIGGSLVAQISARLLQNDAGGKGILLGGIASVPPAEVVIIGAGIFGTFATRAFINLGAHVTVLDISMKALSRIYDLFPGIVTLPAYPNNITRACSYADVVAASILVPGERPPIIIDRDMVKGMKPRSLLMDISIDEGGCVETSRPTTHENPTFMEEGVIHYCVPNIPSIVARTATYGFVNAAMPYILELASKGVDRAILDNPDIEHGVSLLHGEGRHLPRIPHLEEVD